MNLIFRCFASCAMSREKEGFTVLQSIQRELSTSWFRKPFFPIRAVSATASGLASMVMMTVTCFATSAGVGAQMAPAWISESAFCLVLLYTTRS
jgi:hypothetical protein